MRFIWGKELETRIPALDEHHQGIFRCINDFFQKCDEDGGTKEVIALLDTLDCYTRKHFSYEESLQKMNDYPGLERQQEQHGAFLTDISVLKNTLETTGPTRELTVIAKGKLIRWLSHHIKSLDKEFVDYLKAKQS